MKHGDLANTPSPRLVLVFEGLVGSLAVENKKKFDVATRKNRWFEAVRFWNLHPLVLRKMLDLSWRKNFNLNIVTWMPDDAAIEIDDLISSVEVIPIRGCFSSKPEVLARQLPYNPDIIKVYHADPELAFTFGSKGEYVRDVNQIGRL